jgi:hypothetical protein
MGIVTGSRETSEELHRGAREDIQKEPRLDWTRDNCTHVWAALTSCWPTNGNSVLCRRMLYIGGECREQKVSRAASTG